MNELVQNYVIRANLLLYDNFIGCSSTSSLCKHDAKKCPGPYWYGKWRFKKKSDSLLKKPICKDYTCRIFSSQRKGPFEVKKSVINFNKEPFVS